MKSKQLIILLLVWLGWIPVAAQQKPQAARYEVKTEITDTLCLGSSLSFGGRTLTEGGIYTDTIHYSKYDSVIVLSLIGVKPDTTIYNSRIPEGTSVEWNGVRYSEPGVYDVMYANRFGCDSLSRLILTTYHVDTLDTTVVLCPMEHITWHGMTFGETGTYSFPGHRANGDMVYYEMNLTVRELVHRDSTIYLCEGSSVTINGVTYNEAGMHDVYTSCDTVKHYRIVKAMPFYSHETRSLPQGNILIWHNQQIMAEGTYHDYLTTVQGCDSVYEIEVTIIPADPEAKQYSEERTICEGDTVLWRDRFLTRTGTYVDTVYNGTEIDSIFAISLTVHPRPVRIEQYRICEGEQLRINGVNYHEMDIPVGSVYRDTVYRLSPMENMCDSMIILEIAKQGVTRTYETIILDYDQNLPITWHGKTVNRLGFFPDTVPSTYPNECYRIDFLNLIQEKREYKSLCLLDTAKYKEEFQWHGFDLRDSRSGIYRDTAYDATGMITNVYSLEFEMHIPIDTSIFIRTCHGPDDHYFWPGNGKEYNNDTTFLDTLRCDTIYHVHIAFSNNPEVSIVDTICEHELPYILGTQDPKEIWEEGFYTHTEITGRGCDSTINLTLRIIPSLTKTDSTFVCEDVIKENPVILGNLVTPTFSADYGGQYTGEWQSKWKGIAYHSDTIVYNCDSSYSHHIIVRPSQKIIPEKTIYLCHDDSLQLFWPYDTTWFYKDTTYLERRPMVSTWTDEHHGKTYADDSYSCDSVTRWFIKRLPFQHKDTTAHILLGDSLWWNGFWRIHSGSYDSLALSKDTSSFGTPCTYIYTLHLIVDTVYHYHDTVSLFCTQPKTTYTHTWSDGYRQTYTVGSEDMFERHYIDTLRTKVTPIPRDSIYDLMVSYQIMKDTLLFDTICADTHYRFTRHHGADEYWISASGRYTDTLYAQNGCDSVVTLQLYVHPIKYRIEKKIIFDGDSTLFYDGTYKKESGIYNYRHMIEGECADLYQMVVTVVKPVHMDTTATICENEIPFIWRGHEYYNPGQYTIPVEWTDTSCVMMTLNLSVLPVIRQDRTIDLCEGSTFIFRNRTYHENIILYDTIPTTQGCDSIYRNIVRFHPIYDRIDTVHISDKQPYVFHDRTLTISGTYEWTGSTVYGCDSIEHLVLIVHPSFFQSDTLNICQSDSENYPYAWRDENGRLIKTISASGVYTDSILTQYGFDSVHQLVVNIHPMYLAHEQFNIGIGEIIKIHGRDISTPGVYYDTLRTVHGCDSIFHIVVNQRRTREFIWTREVCQGEYYDFFGRKLTHTGQYTYTSPYQDSIVTLNLTVNPITITEKRLVITTPQLPYILGGKIYTEGGIYNDTLVNRFGCDSILRLVLVVTDRYSNWDPIPLCPGTEVKIDGDTITQAGMYTFVRRSYATGEMDSVYRVEVYDAPSFEYDVKQSICEGDSVVYGDNVVKRSGHYDFIFKTVNGCDSIYHLDITVNPNYHFITDTAITDYQTMRWHGKTYLTPGEYNLTLPTVNSCDSVLTLLFHVVPTMRDTTEETICTGQQYTWRGKTYTKDGFYTDTVWNPEVDFSAIYALRLHVAYPTTITSAKVSDICADTEGFDIDFEFDGEQPTHYSVYFGALAKKQGFQDIIDEPLFGESTAHVDLPQYTTIAYETHPTYVRPDYYTLFLVLDNGACGLSKSDSIRLLIKYPNWIIEQNWNDVVLPLKADYNGGYEFSQVEWYVDGALQTNANQGYLQNPSLVPGSQVVMSAIRKGESYAIPTCPLTITEPVPTVHDLPVLVYPNQAPRHQPIVRIDSPHKGSYEIFTTTGLLVGSGTMEEGITDVTLPATNGLFIIVTKHGDKTESHKVLLY